MNQMRCADVRQWTEHVLGGSQAGVPPPTYYRHVAGCEICRGALGLLAHAEPGRLPPVSAGDCALCEGDLPAFIDEEQRTGMPAAAQRFPALWWHLLTCEDCAQVYEGTVQAMALLSDEHAHCSQPSGDDTALEERGALLIVPPLRLSRDLLTVVMPSLQVRVRHGRRADGQVIAEEDLPEGLRLTLSLAPASDTSWTLQVQVLPPLEGRAVLAIGDARFQAAFDPAGIADLILPAALLSSPYGPELVLQVEQEHEAG